MENIFDSHAHYNDERFDDDRDVLLPYLLSNGICGIINCGDDIESSKKSIELSKKYKNIFASVGVHPHSAKDDFDKLPLLYELAKYKKTVAIGEIGLDYHYDFSPRDIQKEVFEKQLFIAKELDLPVIIHSREATEDTLNILKKHNPKGVVHCFSGSVETAKEILKLGMFIGIGGSLTFKNAVKPVEACKYIPLNKILLETDCPYMTPVPFRGKRNDSSYIQYVVKKISEIKNISEEEICNTAKQNTLNLFSKISEV